MKHLYLVVKKGRIKGVKKSKVRVIFARNSNKVVCVRLGKHFLPALCRVGPLINLLLMA